MSTLVEKPTLIQQSELPVPSFLSAVAGDPAIVDMTERVKQSYINWGLLKPGDGFMLSYDRVELRFKELTLGPIDPRKGEPIALHRVEYVNDTDRDQTTTYKESKTVTTSVSVSMTVGFKYSMSVNGSVAIKKIIEIGGEQTWEFSLSSTATASTEVKKEWVWEWPLLVPKRSRVIATALLSQYYVAPSFTALLEIYVAPHPNFDPGYNPLYAAITRSKETTWYRSSLQGALNPHLGGGFSPGKDHNHVLFHCAGKFASVYGRDLMIHLKQTPLDPKAELVSEQIIALCPDGTGSVVALAAPQADNQYAPR